MTFQDIPPLRPGAFGLGFIRVKAQMVRPYVLVTQRASIALPGKRRQWVWDARVLPKT